MRYFSILVASLSLQVSAAFLSTASRSFVSKPSTRSTSSLAASAVAEADTSGGLFDDYTKRKSETPEIDGGARPTAEEIKRIKAVRKKALIPSSIIPAPLRFAIQKYRERKGTNKYLFKLLNTFARGTDLVDGVDLNEDIHFSDDVAECMFFKVKDPGMKWNIRNLVLYRTLQYAPPLVMKKNDDLMTDEDYAEILGHLIQPLGHMMEVDSPLQCFLENVPAFCAEGDDGTSVCDLEYMRKYEVVKGTKHRYGGKAYVKNGQITGISGADGKIVKPTEKGFDTLKNVFLTSFGVHVVLIRHAVMGHLCMYQKYNMALTAKRSDAYKSLWKGDADSSLLLKALTPRAANSVNVRIQLLIGPGNSLVGRGTAFTNDALTLLNIDTYDKYSVMDPETIIKDIGKSGSNGWNKACLRAWDASQKVVDIICKEIKDSPELKDTDMRDLAMLLWIGTFYHGIVGDFQLDNVIKGNLPFYVTGAEHQQTKSYGTLSAVIGAVTCQRCMNMDTLGTYFSTQEARNAWKEYQKELKACAKGVGIKGFTYDCAVYNAIDF